MRTRYKTAIAAGFVAAIATAAAAFGQDGGGSPSPSGQPKAERPAKVDRMMRMVHSESKVQLPDGTFALRIVDHGEITSVDGNRVTIKRLDGETVTVTANDDTKVRRNGEAAAVADLKAGDRAQLLQIETDGSRALRAIRAFEPGFEPERKPERKPGRGPLKRGIRPGRGGPPPGPDAPADTPPADPAFFPAA